MVTVETASMAHYRAMEDDIRLADFQEWFAGTGSADIGEILRATFDRGRYARTAVDENGVCLCMWGVDDEAPGQGSIWLFATEEAERRALSLHRILKPNLMELLKTWPTLHAYSDSRNTKHHLWLEWLGFEYEGQTHLGPFGLPFEIYTRRA